MPKIVDYAARFEFVREAAFAVVLDSGPASLSRQALADALGTSLSTIRRLVSPDASLAGIAAQAVERRRAHGRWGMPRGEDRLRNASRLLESVLPESEERVHEEVVWLRLLPSAAADDAAVARAIAEREYFIRLRLHRVLDELGIPAPLRAQALRELRVHLDGVSLGVALGHLTPSDAVELREQLVLRLRDSATDEGQPPPVTLTA